MSTAHVKNKEFKKQKMEGYLQERDLKRMEMQKNAIFTGYQDDTFLKSRTLAEIRAEQAKIRYRNPAPVHRT